MASHNKEDSINVYVVLNFFYILLT